MKKIFFTLIALLTMTAQANAMSYEQARNEALFLTDKMAYELNLTDAQYEAAYEINLDYLMSVTTRHDVFGLNWERRNRDLEFILYSWQWDVFRAASYFFRPLYWDAGFWHFGVYARYPHRDYFYFGRPHFYASYRGAHSWRMNGGHSFYEHRRDYFRPGHGSRDSHVGMRNGWERGDYRNNVHGGSSTRVTAGDRRADGSRDNNWRGSRREDSHDANRSLGGTRANSGNATMGGTRGSFGETRSNSSLGGTRPSTRHSSGSLGGTRPSTSHSSSLGGTRPSTSHSSGSFGGTRPSTSHSSGSFGGSRSSAPTRSSGGSSQSGGSRR